MAAAKIDELLNEEENTNNSLLEFYKLVCPSLRKIYIGEVPLVWLDKIAALLHNTLQKDQDWMVFLNKLGIESCSDDFTRILFSFKASEQLPIFIALTRFLHDKINFGDFLNFLIKEEKIRVLSDIRPFVEGLLRKISDSNVTASPQLADSELGYEICFSEKEQSESNCKISNKSTKYGKFGKNGWLEKERNRLFPFCGNYLKTNIDKENINGSFKCHTEKTITVFIPHAEEDSSDARKLTMLLEEQQIIVRTLSDLDYIITINLSDAVTSLLNIVDFIVPIVSETFVKEIYSIEGSSKIDDISEEDNCFTNDSINRYIYQLLINEYLQSKCLNFRVRPVRVPGMNRNLLLRDPLLFYSPQLWKTVPKFINILKITKQKFDKITC